MSSLSPTRLLGVAWALAIGCTPPAAPSDRDGDGWSDAEDCRPDDAAGHEGADDPWGDGADSNCDGLDGTDADGDGYPAEPEAAPTDCDDSNPAANPGHFWDAPFDGVDTNCDGTESMYNTIMDVLVHMQTPYTDFGAAIAAADIDGDGQAEVFVGAPGWNGDRGRVYGFRGVDLAGATELDPDDAWWIIEADPSTGARAAGKDLEFDGDIDGDGLPDLLVVAGERGYGSDAAYVLPGALLAQHPGLDLADAPMVIRGDEDDGWWRSNVVWAGDLDGDGATDIALADADIRELYGGVFLFSGADLLAQGELRKADAMGVVHTGDEVDTLLGTSWRGMALASVPDLDGDGTDELLIGDPLARRVHGLLGGFERGLYLPSLETDFGLHQDDFSEYGWLGGSVAVIDDADGDGWPELAVGAPWVPSQGFPDSGGGYVLLVPTEGLVEAGWQDGFRAGVRLTAHEGAEYLAMGRFNVADVDANGRQELLFVVEGDPEYGLMALRVDEYLSSGAGAEVPIAGLGQMRSRWRPLEGGVRAIADINGDGIDDIAGGSTGGGPDQDSALAILFGRREPRE